MALRQSDFCPRGRLLRLGTAWAIRAFYARLRRAMGAQHRVKISRLREAPLPTLQKTAAPPGRCLRDTPPVTNGP
jgi:hypothetical protein